MNLKEVELYYEMMKDLDELIREDCVTSSEENPAGEKYTIKQSELYISWSKKKSDQLCKRSDFS